MFDILAVILLVALIGAGGLLYSVLVDIRDAARATTKEAQRQSAMLEHIARNVGPR